MVHPSTTAQRYIFQRFAAKFLTERARKMAERVEKIARSVFHVPINPHSTGYLRHVERTLDEVSSFQRELYYGSVEKGKKQVLVGEVMDFSNEVMTLTARLQSICRS